MKKLSVIIPVYNGEKYIRKTIESVLNQTYHNMEILVLNDGSDDNTAIILDEYQKSDDRVIVHHLKRGGVSSARNYGIRHSKGELIAFLDADDLIDERCYEKLIKAMDEYEVDVAAASFVEFVEESSILGRPSEDNVIIIEGSESILQSMTSIDKSESIRGYVWNKVYKKCLIDNIPFDESIAMCEDSLFSYDVMLRCNRVVLLQSPLFYYRIREDSATRCSSVEKLLDAVIAYEKLVQKAAQHSLSVKKNYINELIGWCMIICDKLVMPTDKDIYMRIKKVLMVYAKRQYLLYRPKGFCISAIAASINFEAFCLWKRVYSIIKQIKGYNI